MVFRHNVQGGLGADIIFAAGTTGEWNRIQNNERQRLIRIESDEISRLNRDMNVNNGMPVEAWAGVTAETRAETIANLECCLDANIHAAVIAPLSIRDLTDVVTFFQREVSDLFDRRGRSLPIFLYDNAEIAVNPRISHIHTRDVKRLSRLPFLFGIKVSASRRVLGNYTKGALHFKDKGEFGIYIGNAMLMFQLFKLDDGILGRVREYWNRYLLHNDLPIGVVAGPANVWPREWQRAWRACFAGDDQLMPAYNLAFDRFERACIFNQNGISQAKMLACLKFALKLEGVIDSDLVATGTPALTEDDRRTFSDEYRKIRQQLATCTDPHWNSRSIS
jgi:dihydrodipicolinate synthase/N-acetylneuraminate lyase